MIIVINTRSLFSGQPERHRNFIDETFYRIVKEHPEHEFIFVVDKSDEKRFAFAANNTAIHTVPFPSSSLLWKYWYSVKLPAVLKKYKADVLVCGDGCCSLKTKIPQCLLVYDLSFLNKPLVIKKSKAAFLKRNMPKFLVKARSVATITSHLKKTIKDGYQVSGSKIDTVYPGISENFQPLSIEEKIELKNKYTEGKEYFLYSGAIHAGKNLIDLLKAFSLFKKRQQTNMKLVLAGSVAINYNSFSKSLQTYKYRNDVVLTGHLEENELAKLTGASYGLINPCVAEELDVVVLEAMQCNVPVIVANTVTMHEVTKNAALYATASNNKDLADKMMLLYKDEKGRNEMINKGSELIVAFNWDATARLLWQSIQKAIS